MTTLLWLPDVLRAAGLSVVEHRGWRARGRPGAFAPHGVMLHHDASPPGPSPDVPAYCAAGDASRQLPGPLCHLWLATDGTWHVIAAGRANHAGTGGPWGAIGRDTGNADTLGIETDHTAGEAWPPAQLASLQAGLLAIYRHTGWTVANSLLGHREYAPTRKSDPAGLDLQQLRRQLAPRAHLTRTDDPGDLDVTTDELRAIVRAELDRTTVLLLRGDDPEGPAGETHPDNLQQLHAELRELRELVTQLKR